METLWQDLRYTARTLLKNPGFTALAWGGALSGTEKTEVLSGLQVTANLMPMLGVAPKLGRWFSSEEDEAGARRVILLSDGLWQRRFGADPQTIGRSITLDGIDYTVVGVMPPGFHFAPLWQTQAEMWTPLTLASRINDRSGRSLRLFARGERERSPHFGLRLPEGSEMKAR